MPRIVPITAAIFAGIAVFAVQSPIFGAERVVKAPVPRLVPPASGHRETAVFAGGCFWGVEGVFQHVRGVLGADAGYAGGHEDTANYDTVSTGRTGHAEAVRVVFDPTKVSYADLLRVYFSVVADPTELNYQGPDHGPQYRTALFPQNAVQAKVAKAYIAQLDAAHVYPRPIVTRIEPATLFYPAEAHHQDFMQKNPDYPYIVINDRPKVEALKRIFPGVYKG